MITLQFISEVDNDSLQIGDIAYFITPSPLGGFQQLNVVPTFIGPVVDFFDVNGTSVFQAGWNPPMFSIQIDDINPGAQGAISSGDFLMFGKDTSANVSGLIGYYAEVKLNNNSSEKAEMFSIASEITPSSK